MVRTDSPATSVAAVPFAVLLDGVCEDRLGDGQNTIRPTMINDYLINYFGGA